MAVLPGMLLHFYLFCLVPLAPQLSTVLFAISVCFAPSTSVANQSVSRSVGHPLSEPTNWSVVHSHQPFNPTSESVSCKLTSQASRCMFIIANLLGLYSAPGCFITVCLDKRDIKRRPKLGNETLKWKFFR